MPCLRWAIWCVRLVERPELVSSGDRVQGWDERPEAVTVWVASEAWSTCWVGRTVVRWRHLGRGQHRSSTPASTGLVCRSELTGSSPRPAVGRSSQGLWLPKWVGCAVFYSEVWLVFRDLNPSTPLMDLNGYFRSPQILLQMLSPQKGCTFLEWRFRLVLRGLWWMPVCGYSWLKFKQWTFTWI